MLLVAEGEEDVSLLPHGRGAVLGALYAGATPNISILEDSARSVEIFARERWGDYIAIVIDRLHDVISILRSPSGAVPCFLTERNDVAITFSDAEDIVAIAPEIDPDLGFLASFLIYPRTLGRRTGLTGVGEIAPGEAVEFTRTHHSIKTMWSPTSEPSIDTFEEGVRTLRRNAEIVARVLADPNQTVLHRLSGGFDSSAVLGLLSRAMPREQITCLNEFWPNAPEGDERSVARAVAHSNGVRLLEVAMCPERVNYEMALRAPVTVKPTLSALSFADNDVGAVYASVGAKYLTSGQGGDHVLQRSRTSAIAADALRDGAPGLAAIMLETARLTRRSVWGVSQDALLHGLLRRPIPAQPRSRAARLLAEEFAASSLSDHPWIGLEKAMTPARRQRLWHLRDALGYYDRSIVTGAMRPIPMLLAQPVVETCLRIAPYVMTAGGSDRALARAAFADLIPDFVEARVQKGETTRYFAAILTANRNWMGDALGCGELARSGVLKSASLNAFVDEVGRQDGIVADGVYSLVAAEIWLRNLKAAKKRAATHLAEAS